MEVPILKQGSILIATVQSALTDTDLFQLRETLMMRVRRHRSSAVIMDVSALDVMDSFACRALRAIAQAVKLEGAETVLCGIQPDVAFAMVQLGLSLKDITTALDLEDALEYIQAVLKRKK